MKTQRISASSYSNTAPLVWSFLYGSQRGRVEIILDTAPSRSAELLAQTRVSAALVPVIAYQTIENLRLVPEVCVGARERVRSVCLVTKDKNLRDVRSVALDVSSKTSVALTKIIFREFFGFEPVYRPAEPNLDEMLKTSDAALLIGDPALVISDAGCRIWDLKEKNIEGRMTNDKKPFRKFDLVELWREFSGLGFVFAMWMTPEKNCPIDFSTVRDEGLGRLDEIIANYETEIPLGRDDFKRYLSENISYTIDDSMHKGLALFFKLAQKNGLIERNKPLQFIDK